MRGIHRAILTRQKHNSMKINEKSIFKSILARPGWLPLTLFAPNGSNARRRRQGAFGRGIMGSVGYDDFPNSQKDLQKNVCKSAKSTGFARALSHSISMSMSMSSLHGPCPTCFFVLAWCFHSEITVFFVTL